ncbi:MAG: hypothetical protein AAF922_12145 [Pseudomonadota bacterium]
MTDTNKTGASNDTQLPDEIAEALRGMNWDDRLARARAARSKVLAGPEKKKHSFDILAVLSKRAKPLNLAAPRVRRERQSKPEDARKRPSVSTTHARPVIVIALSLMTGAFLQWGASTALDSRQNAPSKSASYAGTTELGAAQTSTFALGAAPESAELTAPAALTLAQLTLPSDGRSKAPEQQHLTAAPELVERTDPVMNSASWHGPAPDQQEGASEGTTSETQPVAISLFIPESLSDEVAGAALETLGGDDTKLVSSERVAFTVRQTQVRFYHQGDAGSAAKTAKAIGGLARDFTATGQKTSPGRLEVYLAGQGGNSGTVATRRVNQLEYYLLRILGQI